MNKDNFKLKMQSEREKVKSNFAFQISLKEEVNTYE